MGRMRRRLPCIRPFIYEMMRTRKTKKEQRKIDKMRIWRHGVNMITSMIIADVYAGDIIPFSRTAEQWRVALFSDPPPVKIRIACIPYPSVVAECRRGGFAEISICKACSDFISMDFTHVQCRYSTWRTLPNSFRAVIPKPSEGVEI